MLKTLFTLMLLPPALFAEMYYVNTSGGDDNNPGSQDKPWQTLGHASGKVKAGDTVTVAPGDYPEAVVIAASGTEAEPVTFRAGPPRAAKVKSFKVSGDYITIEGFDIANDASQNGFGIHCGEAHRKNARTGNRILNNFIHDINGTAIYSGTSGLVKDNTMRNVNRGVFANSGTVVENNEIDTLVPFMEEGKDGESKPKKTQYNFFCGDDIIFRGNYLHGTQEKHLINGMGACFFTTYDSWLYSPSRRILIENNRCFDATHASEPMGTAKKESSHITYRNNLFVNTVYVGVMPKGYEYVTVENNTFINCGAYPVWLQNDKQCKTSVVKNNLIAYIGRERTVEAYGWKAPDAGIRFDTEGPKPDCDHNLIFGAENRNYGPNDITAKPLFVDPDNGDFRLKPGSPGIDAGMTIGDVKTDLRGVGRPQGKAYDIGAYEHDPAQNQP